MIGRYVYLSLTSITYVVEYNASLVTITKRTIINKLKQNTNNRKCGQLYNTTQMLQY